MKKIILLLVIILGVFTTTNAQEGKTLSKMKADYEKELSKKCFTIICKKWEDKNNDGRPQFSEIELVKNEKQLWVYYIKEGDPFVFISKLPMTSRYVGKLKSKTNKRFKSIRINKKAKKRLPVRIDFHNLKKGEYRLWINTNPHTIVIE